MNIVIGHPPIIDEIDAKFHVKHKAVIYAWGDTIYNPTDTPIRPELIAHEKVHGTRQRGNPKAWWRKYIASVQFRLDEEILAHRAEYEYLIDNAPTRQVRRSALKYVAKRLAAPLYGHIITVSQAKRVLR